MVGISDRVEVVADPHVPVALDVLTEQVEHLVWLIEACYSRRLNRSVAHASTVTFRAR